MTRLPRLRSIARTLIGAAPLIGGAAAVAATISAALDQAWLPAAWALVAAGWAFLYAAHRCPTPPVPERGLQCVHFIGGPEDGGGGILPDTSRDLHLTTMTGDGIDYRLGTVEQTCYRAELVPDREAES